DLDTLSGVARCVQAPLFSIGGLHVARPLRCTPLHAVTPGVARSVASGERVSLCASGVMSFFFLSGFPRDPVLRPRRLADVFVPDGAGREQAAHRGFECLAVEPGTLSLRLFRKY